MRNQVLVILGMHRSCTSLITQWLQKCGLQVGDLLANAAPGNIEGHFEDLDFVNFHERVLYSNGFPISGYSEKPVLHLTRYELEKLKKIIELKNVLHHQWGWKDPRTCLFLSHYRKLLLEAKYLVIFRDYHSVVTSLLNRDFKKMESVYLKKGGPASKQMSRFIKWRLINKKRNLSILYKKNTTFYLKIWIKYNEELLKHIQLLKEKDYILVNYRMLINDSDEVFEHLRNWWSFNFEYYDYKLVYKPDLFSKKITDISRFISDPALVDNANQIEKKLQQHLFVNSLDSSSLVTELQYYALQKGDNSYKERK